METLVTEDLNVFEPVHIEGSIESSRTEYLVPTTPSFPSSDYKLPIEFAINSVDNHAIDMSRLGLEVRFKVQYKEQGSNEVKDLPADMKVGFANNVLHSLFSGIELYVNNSLVMSNNYMWPYIKYLETILTKTDEERKGIMSAAGYLDEPSHNGTAVTDTEKDRFKPFIGSKMCTLIGELDLPVFRGQKNLMPGNDVLIRLFRSHSNFFIQWYPTVTVTPAVPASGNTPAREAVTTKEANKLFIVEIVRMNLHVIRHKLHDNAADLLVEKALSSKAMYHFEDWHFKPLRLAAKTYTLDEMLFVGQQPARLVIIHLPEKAVLGQLDVNPFTFVPGGLNHVYLEKNGEIIKHYDASWGSNADFERIYYELMRNYSCVFQQTDNSLITRTSFANAYCIMSLNLEPIFESCPLVRPEPQACSLRLRMIYNTSSTTEREESYIVACFLIFRRTLFIEGKDKNTYVQ